ncbi:DUF2637 domain-containing protein [Streptomyces sp. KL118A]|uniref:DUF2637 domain-containing protein n=1 Tax=Streptomyces sp. KL118A TaxID=3045153 RepID=UPI00278BD5A4|nr:DUF2637 domain-containing protein [Streptomyces sp. KL118A]
MDAVLVQAVIAGALSFAHLHDLAAAAGQDGWKAWAYPVSVDLLLVAAWRRLRSGGPSGLGWCWFLVALVASLGANVATAGFLDMQHPPAWLRFGVAGWPALAFLGGTLLAHSPTPTGDRTPVPPKPAAPAPAPEETTPAPVPEPEEIPAPDPAPALPEAAAPGVPPALIEHARKVATEHHTRTGTQIDAATLRARLGVPEALATTLVAQLA